MRYRFCTLILYQGWLHICELWDIRLVNRTSSLMLCECFWIKFLEAISRLDLQFWAGHCAPNSFSHFLCRVWISIWTNSYMPYFWKPSVEVNPTLCMVLRIILLIRLHDFRFQVTCSVSPSFYFLFRKYPWNALVIVLLSWFAGNETKHVEILSRIASHDNRDTPQYSILLSAVNASFASW